MSGFGFADWNKAVSSGGGAKYFSLKDGESAIVRFAYNTIAQDLKWYVVHEFRNPSGRDGATISCAEPDPRNPAGVCKWCAMGNPGVKRVIVIVPVYDVQKQSISYWKRTVKFVNDSMLPFFQELESQGKPICAQQYKITRHGNALQTTYPIIPMGAPDSVTLDALGKVEDPFDLNMIRPSDCDYDPNIAAQQSQATTYNQQNNGTYNQANNYNSMNSGYNQNSNFGGQQNGFNNFQTPAPTRRTADTF